MSTQSNFRTCAVAGAFLLFLGSIPLVEVWSQEKPFRNVVITEVLIGDIEPGRYAFKATVTTVAPEAEIPFHTHSYPGIRYMLEGALTIHWKDHGSQTFSAGSTYYEGAGENHPRSGMSAANPLNIPAKVLIIELVRVE